MWFPFKKKLPSPEELELKLEQESVKACEELQKTLLAINGFARGNTGHPKQYAQNLISFAEVKLEILRAYDERLIRAAKVMEDFIARNKNNYRNYQNYFAEEEKVIGYAKGFLNTVREIHDLLGQIKPQVEKYGEKTKNGGTQMVDFNVTQRMLDLSVNLYANTKKVYELEKRFAQQSLAA